MVRTHLIAVALVVTPALAPAQTDAPPELPPPAAEPAAPPPSAASGEAASGEKEASALPASDDTTPRDFGGAFEPGELGGKSDEHVVERGDTLWDLSGKFMGNPWYWPKVWSYNPEIENPHWIYPGDQVRFYPQTDVEDGEALKEELADVSKGTWDAPTYGESDDVTVAGRIGFAGPRNLLARHDGFVTERELAESGTIEKSWEEKNLLVERDRLYIDWGNRSDVKVGQEYVLFRSAREIEHPVNGRRVGYLTQVLGSARVVDTTGPMVTAEVVRSFSEIERGDHIGPVAGAFVRSVGPKPNTGSASGVICATLEPDAGSLGQWTVVFLDIGRNQGLEEGNTLDVLRAGDGLDDDGFNPYYDSSVPAETMGKLLVLDTKESSSAALVMKALREVRIGDRVEMVPSQSAPSAAR